MSLYDTGVRPIVDKYLLDEAAKVRDYGDYWSASSAGYCMRKVIFDRLQVPHTSQDPRKQRVFTSGHIFHEWMQGLTKDAGVSVAQELELQDETIMVRGHFDDLIIAEDKQLILYDYKTQNSRAFSWQKKNASSMSHFHKMQLGTYMYMLRKVGLNTGYPSVQESRILKISKDDLRMSEEQLLWSADLEKEVVQYWATINGYWKSKTLPKCTCADYEGGFMANEKYNPYYYNGEPCSLDWYKKWKEEHSDDNK